MLFLNKSEASVEKRNMFDRHIDQPPPTEVLNKPNPAITYHISDDDLERHFLGAINRGLELEMIEDHLLWCEICIWRRRKSEKYVEFIRTALAELLLS
jgi:hypothetical protein